MFRTFFNSQLQRATSGLAKNFPFLRKNVVLSPSSASPSFQTFFTSYNAQADEPVLEKQERPGYYNVYDEDEFSGQEKEPNPDRTPLEEREDPPAMTNRVPPEEDAKGPLGEGVV